MDEVSLMHVTVDSSVLAVIVVLTAVGAVGGAILVWWATSERTPMRLLRCAIGAAGAALVTLTGAYVGTATTYLAYAILAKSFAASTARLVAGGFGVFAALLAIVLMAMPLIARVSGNGSSPKHLASNEASHNATR